MKTFFVAIAAVACVASASAQVITGFEGYANGTEVMFRAPTFSGSTTPFIETTPNFSGVTNVFPADNPNAGGSVYNTIFAFKASQATPWLRLTSNGTGILPNPAVSFTSPLSFDIFSDKALYVALLLRETSTTAAIGGNGGGSGGTGIEFVGGTPNSTTVAKGKLVPANTWTTLVFDIPNEPVSGFTGNGILASTTGKGALEALGFSTDANNSGVWNVYLDNITVVPEPGVMTLGVFGLALMLLRRRL